MNADLANIVSLLTPNFFWLKTPARSQQMLAHSILLLDPVVQRADNISVSNNNHVKEKYWVRNNFREQDVLMGQPKDCGKNDESRAQSREFIPSNRCDVSASPNLKHFQIERGGRFIIGE